MNLDVVAIQPLVALIAGILILLVPRILNYVVAIYLILIGLLGAVAAPVLPHSPLSRGAASIACRSAAGIQAPAAMVCSSSSSAARLSRSRPIVSTASLRPSRQ